MHDPPRILIVDDDETCRDILSMRLSPHGYHLIHAANGQQAVDIVQQSEPDLILLDIIMPKLDGIEVTRRLKANPNLPFLPIILVSSKRDIADIALGLEAGADEYITKPVDQASLVARVKSMLRVKELHDRAAAQATDLTRWKKTLEQRVADQLRQIERLNQLKRFLPPQIADIIVGEDSSHALESHRREITVVFCELQRFDAFAELAEPEIVMELVRAYHANLGPLINQYEGTVERVVGDGFLVLFNDPLPCPDRAVRSVRMALQMRDRVADMSGEWRKLGLDLGFGVGIAQGYATIGCIGFEGRSEYSAMGTVVNLAARLCSQAHDGQILIDPRVKAAVETLFRVEPAGELVLKGLSRPIKAFNIPSVDA
jgi:adenylate cyclase